MQKTTYFYHNQVFRNLHDYVIGGFELFPDENLKAFNAGLIKAHISLRLRSVVENAVEEEFANISKSGGSYETATSNVYDMVDSALGDIYAEKTIDGIISAIKDSSQMQGWLTGIDRQIQKQTKQLMLQPMTTAIDPKVTMQDVEKATDNISLAAYLEALNASYY